MKLDECLASDFQRKIQLTEDMVHEVEETQPQKASELRSQLYAIQVILNEIEDEYVELHSQVV
ncbi:MAG TPA: hypothetical protein VKA34_08135 [Balneolales bacterium]|nr:hypothetical protein [Balneolales bacterium]